MLIEASMGQALLPRPITLAVGKLGLLALGAALKFMQLYGVQYWLDLGPSIIIYT